MNKFFFFPANFIPTNGLDPQGIAEVRALLRRLHREEGCTLLISSHILSEIEQLCTHAAILHRGRIAFQGAIEDIRHKTEGKIFRLETGEPAAAYSVLRANHYASVQEDGQWLRIELDGDAPLNDMIDLLRRQSITILQLIRQQNTLESAYLKILGA